MHYAETEISSPVDIVNHLPEIGIEDAQREIIEGLKADEKYISSKFFYDKKGSELFERITRLDEYYPTRTEKKILSTVAEKLDLNFDGVSVVELGSGDSSKIRILLDRIPNREVESMKYYPTDISLAAIEGALQSLAVDYPALETKGFVVDFTRGLDMIPSDSKRLFCFLGGTIGNFDEEQRTDFLSNLGAIIKQGDGFLLGTDLVKDTKILNRAYNDSAGVTAEFNKNILNNVNSIIDSDFDTDDFIHRAEYLLDEKKIEMRLVARRDLTVRIGAVDDEINIRKGETIHTENSHKFTLEDVATIADQTGMNLEEILTDRRNYFSLAYFVK